MGMPDLWLVDHVFQPVCDRLHRWGTCFDIARSLGVGVAVLGCLTAFTDPTLGGLAPRMFTALLGISLVVFVLLLMHLVERRLKPGMVNPIRANFGLRYCWFFSYGMHITRTLMHSLSLHDFIDLTINLLMICGAFFASCSTRPPVRTTKAARVPAGLGQGA